MNTLTAVSPQDALDRLKAGNEAYRSAAAPTGDISREIREKTLREGQSPYAVVITCADSRVIPEYLFSCGVGELFVIRVAGNVMSDHTLGSVEYALSHLGCRLVVVLGHTHCGAVEAAVRHRPGGFVKTITDEICLAIGEETDEDRACLRNVRHSVRVIRDSLGLRPEDGDRMVCGAVYRLEDGGVEFLEEV